MGYTLKPSRRRQACESSRDHGGPHLVRVDELLARGLAVLCNALVARLRQSPRRHGHRTLRVSGHEQQIFLPDLPSFGAFVVSGAD